MRPRLKNLEQVKDLLAAEKLFRKLFNRAVSMYDESVRSGEDPPYRVRWTKEEVMAMCNWSYLNKWRLLRDHLEGKVGLIMLLHGARRGWGSPVRAWTFATCVMDRERSIAHSALVQIGTIKRTARVLALGVSPPDERYALGDGSETNLNILLKKQEVKIGDVIRSIQEMKDDLLASQVRERLHLSPRVAEREEDEYDYGQGDPFARKGDID